MNTTEPIIDPDLAADCSRCFGLCCTALSFTRQDGFGHDKPAGISCHFLQADHGCAIHPRRESLGYEGCIDFDCLGAGQRASAQFAGRNWQKDPAVARQLHARFAELLKLQEIKAALVEAAALKLAPGVEKARREALHAAAKSADEYGEGSGDDLELVLGKAREVLKQIPRS